MVEENNNHKIPRDCHIRGEARTHMHTHRHTHTKTQRIHESTDCSYGSHTVLWEWLEDAQGLYDALCKQTFLPLMLLGFIHS